MWNYAKMSAAAKQFGGPEKYVDYIFRAGRQAGMKEMRTLMKPSVREAAAAGIKTGIKIGKKAGRKEMVPFVAIAAIGGAVFSFAVTSIVDHFNNKEVSSEELEAVKAELIQGIKDYDASHPEEGDLEELGTLDDLEELDELDDLEELDELDDLEELDALD